ncbi:hypothetical protein Dsin_014619 [Dipteronia sinensis]|uniref:TF-B3 domain-containing protein n=1 Tax=Dipteronia sinensis TaxID=43782 RepID=A0AAE0ANE3_9ROSI|nr:hypothetical protein Dsin_014619 [Dipteronia sinensis]
MAPQNSQSVILFGRDISQEPQEGGSSGGGGGSGGSSGGGQGCSSTSLQQQQKPEKEKSHINEGCSSTVVQNCVAMENNNNNLTKRKRPVEDVVHDNDHQQRSDATSELTQQQNHRDRDRDRIFLINKTRKLPHEASGASSSSSSKNTTQKFINEILKKNGVYSSNNNNNSNQTVVVVVPRREQNFFVESSMNRTQQQQQRLQRQRQVENMRWVAMRIRSFRNYTPEEEEEERRRGVTTWLQLYPDPWKIKKKLKMSDLGGLSRFLIPANLVDNHVKPFMVRAGLFDKVIETSSDGLRVFVWDVETESEHKMVFKRWNSSGSFILSGSWCPEFVHRRDLKEGDEVGFLWDPYSSRFLFRVLSRALNPHPNPIH